MENDGTAHIGVLTAEFFIPDASCLKDKRSVLKHMFACVKREFNVAAAETGYQDKWQRSQWAFCFVGPDKAYLDGLVQNALEFLRSGQRAQLTDYHIEFL